MGQGVSFHEKFIKRTYDLVCSSAFSGFKIIDLVNVKVGLLLFMMSNLKQEMAERTLKYGEMQHDSVL